MIVALSLLALVAKAHSAGFSFADYPGVYNSYAVDGAYETSGVISATPSTIPGCEFYNSSGSTAWFSMYNTTTVAAQTVGNMIGYCPAAASSVCSVAGAGPSGPGANAAIPAGKGVTWYASSTFPSQTGIGANGFVICTYKQ